MSLGAGCEQSLVLRTFGAGGGMPDVVEPILDGRMLSRMWAFLGDDAVFVLQAAITTRVLVSLSIR